MGNILERIENFGSVDAEEDKRLFEYFYQTPLLQDLLDYNKSIVIGRKGTGKTALYKYIAHHNPDTSTKLLFRDYPWKTHDIYKNTILSDRESYIHSWEFFFYIEFIKKIVSLKIQPKDKRIKKAIKQLRKWLSKNWGSTSFDHTQTLSPSKSSYIWTFNPQILGNGIGSISRDIKSSDNIGNTLSEYNKKLVDILLEIVESTKIELSLLFDELDLAYSPDDTNYKSRLIGLLLAAFSLSQKTSKLRVYIFLRSDIFNILEFQDKRKLKDSIMLFLDWEGDSVESILSLKQLIANRIQKSINSSSDNFERNWNEIFDSKNIGKNQLKWNFFIERSFIRPRDLIKLMNLSLEKAQARIKNKPSTLDKITNEDVHEIRNTYSRFLFEELKDEVLTKYIDYDRYFEILRNIHRSVFDLSDFNRSYKKMSSIAEFKETPEVILDRLFEFGIIGFYKPGGGGRGGSEYCFQYTSELQTFNPRASKFRIHPGFKEHLELIE